MAIQGVAVPQRPISAERFSRTAIGAWITTTDHKKIGVMYMCTGFFFFLVGGFEALLIRTQLAVPNNTVLSAEQYNEVFTMHGTTMIFLFVMPFFTGLGNYVVPLMIGARDMAFPRLNALGYWLVLFAGIFLNLSFVAGAAPNSGWFSYAPLTESINCNRGGALCNPGQNMDFWVLGILILGVSSLVGALNFVVTILRLRAPGLTINRMPLFTWMTLITSFLLLFALPSLTAASAFLFFDRHLGTHFYQYAFGGDPLLWQHLFWSFGHPEVYILILPAFGIASEVLPVFSRKPIFGYTFVAWSGVAIGFLSFTVWAHHMFAVGLPITAQAFFATTTTLIAIPTAVKIFNWLGTIYGGKLHMTTAMYFAIGFVAMFLIGGLNGAALAIVPFDYQVTDTYFVVSHIHYVLFGGAAMAIFSALFYWFPKFSGKFLNETLGKIQFWIVIIGLNLAFFPMHLLGLLGMPRRIYTYASNGQWDSLNLLSTIGAFIIALGVALFIVNFFMSMIAGQKASDDPWDAFTLEWMTTSPPAVYNFKTIPTVRSRRPFYDLKHPDNPDWKRRSH